MKAIQDKSKSKSDENEEAVISADKIKEAQRSLQNADGVSTAKKPTNSISTLNASSNPALRFKNPRRSRIIERDAITKGIHNGSPTFSKRLSQNITQPILQ